MVCLTVASADYVFGKNNNNNNNYGNYSPTESPLRHVLTGLELKAKWLFCCWSVDASGRGQ
jgi:hypothetical protein